MIYLGADHGGFDLKEKIKKLLTGWEYQWEDLGNTVYDPEDDYPQYAFAVAQKVAEGERGGLVFPTPWRQRAKGILLCRSAGGVIIAANKVERVRAVTAFNARHTEHARLHNDANVLALAADWLEDYQVEEMIKMFVSTEFSGEDRHVRRLKQIESFEQSG